MLKQTTLTKTQAQDILTQVVGMNVSKTWRGYGPTIFFEIGKLSQENIGKFTLSVDNNWTLCFEKEGCYSVNDLELADIDSLLEKVVNAKILRVKIIQEKLIVFLDDNRKIIINDYKSDNWSFQFDQESFIFYQDEFIRES